MEQPSSPPTDPNQGRVLAGTYRIIRLLGEGGMGKVYEAGHLRLAKKHYAVKVLHAGTSDSAEVYARFRREAEIATELGHPNIVEVHDFNVTEEGQPFIVMELLTGHDLGGLLQQKQGRLSRQELIPIVAQVGSALTAAHERGVIHRDLKPENIFLTRDPEGSVQVKLLDFGLSTIKHQRSRLTQGGAVMGTPEYMAPEQARGEVGDVDPRTDIFALGVIVYQCLSGKLPFEAPTPLGILYKVVNELPRPVAELNPTLPAELDVILARAMAKSREERYQTVDAFVQELTHVLERPARMAGPDTEPVPRLAPGELALPAGAVTGPLPARPAPSPAPTPGPRDDDELEETPPLPVPPLPPLSALPPGAPPVPRDEPITEEPPGEEGEAREPPKVMVSRSLAPGVLVVPARPPPDDATAPRPRTAPPPGAGSYFHEQDTVEKLRGGRRWARVALVGVLLLLLGVTAFLITVRSGDAPESSPPRLDASAR